MFESWQVLKEDRSEICVGHGSKRWCLTPCGITPMATLAEDREARATKTNVSNNTRASLEHTFCKVGSEILVQLVNVMTTESKGG